MKRRKRHLSFNFRIRRSKKKEDGAPMILVPETTDRECIKSNTLSSIGFLAFVTSVMNAVIQVYGDLMQCAV